MNTRVMTYNTDGTPRCTDLLCDVIKEDGCISDDKFVSGYSISGKVLTITMKDGTQYPITLPINDWIDEYFKAKPVCA